MRERVPLARAILGAPPEDNSLSATRRASVSVRPSTIQRLSTARVVFQLSSSERESLVDIQAFYGHKFSENQRILLQGNFDPNFLGLDLSYSVKPQNWEGTLNFNTWVSSGSFAPFDIDYYKVKLPSGEEPMVQSLGAGVEYVQPFTEDLKVAFGVNYYQYGFSDDLFAGNRYNVDRNFSPVTVNGRNATERFTSLRVNGIYTTLDDPNLPTEGTKIRFGMEQAIGLGDAGTSFNRLSANIAHLFRAPGFNDGDHSLLLNLQAGTILGSPPPVRAFHLGGTYSVRGYNPGELASGRSFVQGTVEYRHFLTDFEMFDQKIATRLSLFGDYASTLGTTSQLKAYPSQVLGKPEDGYGYGAGLQFGTDFGLMKIETAWNDQGRNSFYFTVGERF